MKNLLTHQRIDLDGDDSRWHSGGLHLGVELEISWKFKVFSLFTFKVF
jgi:hypothetical protein